MRRNWCRKAFIFTSTESDVNPGVAMLSCHIGNVADELNSTRMTICDIGALFAYRALRNIWRDRADHSGLMPAARITLPHLSVSSAMSLPKSTGDIGIGSAPSCVSRSLILGSASPALTSLLSLPMISGDVFFGAPTPHQLLTS